MIFVLFDVMMKLDVMAGAVGESTSLIDESFGWGLIEDRLVTCDFTYDFVSISAAFVTVHRRCA